MKTPIVYKLGQWLLLLSLLVSSGGCSSSDDKESIPVDKLLGVVGQLGSYNHEEREAAVKKIRSHPRAPMVAALREILTSKVGNFDLRTRVQVAIILATWKDEDGNVDKTGLPDLIEALRGANDYLRELAEQALPCLGSVVVKPVSNILVSGQKSNRMSAVSVLGELIKEKQDSMAAIALQDMLKSEDEVEVRMSVLIKYAKWNSKKVMEGLLDSLTDPNEDIREYAWKEIKNRVTPPFEYDAFDEPSKRASVIQKLRSWWGEKGKTVFWKPVGK